MAGLLKTVAVAACVSLVVAVVISAAVNHVRFWGQLQQFRQELCRDSPQLDACTRWARPAPGE